MTFTIPNTATASFASQAEPDSLDIATLASAPSRQGVLSGCAVTPSTGLSVLAASGFISNTNSAVALAGATVTLAAADTTNPRFDIIVGQSGGSVTGVTGTPATHPTFPALPANSVLLAAVYVPANATSVTTANIVDKRIILDTPTRPTLFVAASNASVVAQAAADYLCTGTNDDVTIQAALNALPATGGTVVLSEGTFTVGSTININKSYIGLVGVSRASILIAATGLNAFMIVFVPAAGVGIVGTRLAHLTIDQDNAAHAKTAGGCIDAEGAVECVFDDLHLTHPYDWCLKLGPIDATPTFGHNNRLHHIQMDNGTTSAGIGGGLFLTSNDENNITDCDFQFLVGTTASTPNVIRDASGLNTFVGCTIVGGNGEGFRVQNAHRSKIIACTFDGPGRDAVHLSGQRVTVTGCIFSDTGSVAAGTYSHVVVDVGGSNETIVGNTFDSPSTAGRLRSFYRETGSGQGNNIVTGNQFYVEGALSHSPTLELNGTGTVFKDNIGVTTEQNISTSITGDGTTTSFTITHSLYATPVTVVGVRKDATGGAISVDTFASTSFKVHFATAPASTLVVPLSFYLATY